MATIAEINTKITAAITAMEAGDYATAETAALAAEVMLAVKPDTEFSKEKLIFDREAISRFVAKMGIKAKASSLSSGCIVQIPVRRYTSELE